MSYNRYKSFSDNNGRVCIVPSIQIPVKSTDKYITYEEGKTRFDLVSYQYYGDPNYAWLILQANPDLGSLEFRIENGSEVRIPYPLESTLLQYENDIKLYTTTDGLNFN